MADHPRRNSTGNIEMSSSKEKVLPNYLRASAGSCHDICKYGCSTEARLPAKSLSGAQAGDLQKKNKLPGNNRPPLDLTSRNGNQLGRRATHPSQSRPSVPWKIAGISSSNTPQHRRRLSDSVVSWSLQSTENNMFSGSASRRNGGSKVINDAGSSTFGNRKTRELLRSTTVRSSSNKVLKNQNVVTESKTRKGCEKTVAGKTLHIIESTLKIQVNGSARHSFDSSSFNQRTYRDEAITSERILSDKTRQCIGFSGTSQKKEGHSIDIEGQVTRKGTEDSDGSPRKLKLKEGEVIHSQHEKTSPRKLKLRQHTLLAENRNSNTDATGQSLRKTETESLLDVTQDECVSISLRHQIVKGEKGSLSLYNNIIEETANKLVRSKKSKVKALVGAFERVMSLLDTNNSQASKT